MVPFGVKLTSHLSFTLDSIGLKSIKRVGKESILIFYEANFVARKTRAPLNQSSRNFPDIFVFTVPNTIEISFFQIHPKSGVMGQSGKVEGSMDSRGGGVLHYKFIRGCAPQGFLLRPNPRNLVRY